MALESASEITRMETLHPRKSQVVERRFGGLRVRETAEVLKLSPEMVAREWRLTKDWLLCELSNEALNGA